MNIMKMKKLGVGLLSAALLFPVVAPVVSHAEENTTVSEKNQIQETTKKYFKSVEGMGSQYTEEQSKEIIDSVAIVSKYIKPNEHNQLELDSKVKEQVSPFVYEHYQRGIQAINQATEAGYAKINVENNQLEATPLANNSMNNLVGFNAKDGIQYSSVDSYWWGVKWYMSKSESQQWQNNFADGSFYWGSIAAITGLLTPFFPPAAIASAVSVIMSVGNYHCYRELRDHTSARGSVMTISWLDKEIYANKR
ncbi:hypothetical protein BK751_08960 [Bacillus thuringiensis serovar galleriae]|uniref:Uncharacterized protein n=2 Tax=Bacillaceae TaxID=186817 RepID=A0A242WC04_BACTU|nr:hypothetical protein [Bacillus thuringiensis]OTW46854.1 hypothetical protein BK701_33355 [Bacillus thuringiensis serovar amagiensis]OTW51787.1 hypothetical protein BK699_06570 [Bacillus thuringiensis serovar mexicanensis]OTX71656.1 hypothetical protein BK719_13525 [Bacillus thuringiensis serovar novosibirsk]OTY54785.1 hypothetical protein BK747_28675 [Bacillus thuringiensis serovar azorensis]OTY91708.1 hypothetical protein BK751_08960 [Bacillus thuringiensis serovar galleriae]OTZ43174.1 hy